MCEPSTPSFGNQYGCCAHSTGLRGSSTPAARTSAATAATGARRRSVSLYPGQLQTVLGHLTPALRSLGDLQTTLSIDASAPGAAIFNKLGFGRGTSPVIVGAINHKLLVMGGKWLRSRGVCNW